MKRTLFLLWAGLLAVMPLQAQAQAQNQNQAQVLRPEAQSPVLRFDAQGDFKIVQFTDLHYKFGNPASEAALDCVRKVLEAERPDLVVVTGDVVTAKPAREGWGRVLEVLSGSGIPFAVTFGNHDHEQDMVQSDIYDLIRTFRGCLMPARGAQASPDYVLEVYPQARVGEPAGDKAQKQAVGKQNVGKENVGKENVGKENVGKEEKPAALLWCLDSHDYTTFPDKDKENNVYGWLTFDQIAAYRSLSARYTRANGGKPLPALAFFHIPLPEYQEALSHKKTAVRGIRMEQVCCPQYNTGMFTAMKEAGDVMGVFVGHDHDNDYTAYWKDILLCYGRYTGGNTVYNHLPNGARVIVLHQGERSFETWIRQRDGQKLQVFRCPHDYTRD